jgi:SanA protein
MIKKMILNTFRLILILAVSGASLALLIRGMVMLYAHPLIETEQQSKGSRAAIVFGAGLTRDGRPTPVLRDRVETAVNLYHAGKVEKLLMSGDNRFEYYNEPAAMRQYALDLGVPDEAIVLDFAGRRTYDTCYRAKAIFNLQEAVLVTQRFHLARALFTCTQMGLKATGVVADRRTYFPISRLSWQIREIPATLNALLDVLVTHPVPVLGEPEPIFPDPTLATKPKD